MHPVRTVLIFAALALLGGCASTASNRDTTPSQAPKSEPAPTLAEAGEPGATTAAVPTVASAQPPPQHLVFNVPPIAIAEEPQIPRALTRLEWPVVAPDRALASQRRRVRRATEQELIREQLALASLLWDRDNATEESRLEARGLLRELVDKGAPTEPNLAMLSIAELTLGDIDGTRRALDDLILRFPRSERHWGYRAARASLAMESGDLVKAGQIINGADLESTDTPAEVFYVTGWLEYRAGNYPQAYALLSRAARNWVDLDTWDFLRDELYQFAAMADVAYADSSKLIDSLLSGPPRRVGGTRTIRTRTMVSGGKRIVMTRQTGTTYSKSWELVQLASAYLRAGNLEDARAALPSTLAVSDFPGATAVGSVMLSEILDAERKPEESARTLIDAWRALGAAEDQYEDAAMVELSRRIMDEGPRLADDYERIFQATGDLAYARGAATLFGWLAENEAYGATQEARDRASELAQAAGATPPRADYDEAIAAALARRGRVSLRPCYFRALQQAPSVRGTVTLSIELSNERATVSSSPGPDDPSLGAVALCAVKAARLWSMPGIDGAGKVTINVPVEYTNGRAR